jgi:hypothetical protein
MMVYMIREPHNRNRDASPESRSAPPVQAVIAKAFYFEYGGPRLPTADSDVESWPYRLLNHNGDERSAACEPYS